MKIQKIILKNYRNIRLSESAFSDGINILYGENANGKTNTVEAVYMFAGGKSFRAKSPAEAVMFGADAFEVSLFYKNDNSDYIRRMNIKQSRDKLKSYSKNGVVCDKISEFMGEFRAVLFTPDHLSLIKGVPDFRRRFMDMAISQIKPVYITLLSEYVQILAQRNKLLRDMKYSGREKDLMKLTELEVWTEKLCALSASVTRYRGEYASKLKTLAPEFYSGISGNNNDIKEKFDISYHSQINKYDKAFADYVSAESMEKCTNLYRDVYNKGQNDELRFGTTLFGPHRDDLVITLGGMDARTVASQGQQRSSVLALKLAEGEIAKLTHGEYPVFLFDDILSELDRSRQSYILKKLADRQVIITCCNPELFDHLGIDSIIEVKGGTLHRSSFFFREEKERSKEKT